MQHSATELNSADSADPRPAEKQTCDHVRGPVNAEGNACSGDGDSDRGSAAEQRRTGMTLPAPAQEKGDTCPGRRGRHRVPRWERRAREPGQRRDGGTCAYRLSAWMPLESRNCPPIVIATNAGMVQRRSREKAPMPVTASAVDDDVPRSTELTDRPHDLGRSPPRCVWLPSSQTACRHGRRRVRSLTISRIAPAVALPITTNAAARPTASAVAADGFGWWRRTRRLTSGCSRKEPPDGWNVRGAGRSGPDATTATRPLSPQRRRRHRGRGTTPATITNWSPPSRRLLHQGRAPAARRAGTIKPVLSPATNNAPMPSSAPPITSVG